MHLTSTVSRPRRPSLFQGEKVTKTRQLKRAAVDLKPIVSPSQPLIDSNPWAIGRVLYFTRIAARGRCVIANVMIADIVKINIVADETHRSIAKSKKSASGVGATKRLGTSIVVSSFRFIQFEIRVSQCPSRTPHFCPIWIAHSNPCCGEAILVPLADGKRLTCSVRDTFYG